MSARFSPFIIMTRSLVTLVELDTQQLQFIIDVLWGHDPKDTRKLAEQHRVKETDLVCHLCKCLNDALAELD